jgi:signal transduction histidine kinase
MIKLRFSAANAALAYVAVTFAVLALFVIPLWFAWQHSVEQYRVEVLQAEAHRMRNLLASQGVDALAAAIDSQVGGDLVKQGQLMLLATPTLQKRAGNLAGWPPGALAAQGSQFITVDVDGRKMKAAIWHEALPNGYHALVGRDVSRFEDLEQLFWYGLVGSGTLVLAVAIVGGQLIRRALLSRVQHISQTASRIVAGDLSGRLPATDDGDELEMLARTVNRMLDQIEQLVHGVRNTSNAIAHDLRTPLAELRSRLEELAVTRPAPEQAFAEVESAMADVDRVIGIFNALLRLAEIDSGMRRAGFVKVDVSALAAEVVELYQPVAELKGIALTYRTGTALEVTSDPVLLAQAIGNLIDNALKYGKHTVLVEARDGVAEGGVAFSVSDDGSGVPDEEKPKVIERFYRSDASRATPGVGLGLSLVAAVARLHGGTLELSDNHPGLRVTLTI